jgi:hypothetical protein
MPKNGSGSAKLEASLLNFWVRAHWTSKTLCYDLRKGFKKLWFSDYCFEIMNSAEASFSYSSSVPMTSHTVRFFDRVGSWSMQRKSSFSISVNTPTRNWLTKVLASWDNYLTSFQSFADIGVIYGWYGIRSLPLFIEVGTVLTTFQITYFFYKSSTFWFL